MAERFVLFLRYDIHFPPIHDPSDQPSIKTDITMDKMGEITPNEAKAILNQII